MSNTNPHPDLFESCECPTEDGERVVQRLEPRKAEVGGIPISRVLPQRARRSIGAWCFLDHAGPTVFSVEAGGMRVGPHPHTCLQTFTWMLAGEVLHQDSLGHHQVIRPGQLNLMTAGRGIAHTEESVASSGTIHAAQLWIALPQEHKNTDPRFDHYPDLPRWTEQGVDASLLIGTFGEHRAPTLAFSPLVGVDLISREARGLSLPVRADFEYGAMVLEGQLEAGRETLGVNELAYFGCGLDDVRLELGPDTRVLLLGGRPLGEEIFMWWNFVAHSREAIITAHNDWASGSPRFGPVPGFDGPRLEAPPIPWRR